MKQHRLIGYAEELRKSGEDGTTSTWHLVDRGCDASMGYLLQMSMFSVEGLRSLMWGISSDEQNLF